MDKKKAEIENAVRRLIRNLKGFHIEKAVVFGSRIRGDHLDSSDLDVILVSKDFSKYPFTKRISEVSKYCDKWEGGIPLEILCYTPDEFEKKSKQIGLVKDALSYGLLIDL